MTRKTVVVVGASGFVGAAVADALARDGHQVLPLKAPRLAPMDPGSTVAFIGASAIVDELAERFAEADAVVNAAGNPDASSTDEAALTSANAVLPGLLAAACAKVPSTPRFVHVSSAVVQGRAARLDESRTTDGFSAYARSKILGEELSRQFGHGQCTVYRPPSVHDASRRVTRTIARLGSSPLGTVAAPGTAPTPQALIGNVASALAFIATTDLEPPEMVMHPWECLTTAGLLTLLGRRTPRVVPRPLARAIVASATRFATLVPRLEADSRRLEMVWFGQQQAESWLTRVGWRLPLGAEAWDELAHSVTEALSTEEERTPPQ